MKDDETKDIEPFEYVIEWNNMFLLSGPYGTSNYDSVPFKWTKDHTAAQEFPRSTAENRIRYYKQLNIDCRLTYLPALAC